MQGEPRDLVTLLICYTFIRGSRLPFIKLEATIMYCNRLIHYLPTTRGYHLLALAFIFCTHFILDTTNINILTNIFKIIIIVFNFVTKKRRYICRYLSCFVIIYEKLNLNFFLKKNLFLISRQKTIL